MKEVTSPVHCIHPSNGLTCIGLAVGVGAIAEGLHGNAAGAAALVALAALADTFDGRFARLFARSPRMEAFGAQLDSLSDAVVFGAAPVVCTTAAMSISDVGAFWWPAAFAYLLSALTRLGFYNVSDDRQAFVGVPAPAAAPVWSSAMLLWPDPHVIAVVFVTTGILMVAPIHIRRPSRAGFVAFVLWPIGLVVAYISTR
jgi:CDP-diacylglycerol---serine O-phosphatidyltransferase